jgi:hypothetical protein
VNQKRVRASRASVPLTSPSDHGMSRKSISAPRPAEAMIHMAKVTSDMNAASGVRSPGWAARQRRQVRVRLSVTSQVPTTTSVRPT